MLTAEYLLTALVIVLIPGTGVLYTVSTAVFLGPRAGVYAALGCTFGIVPHLLASIAGLAALWHMSSVAFEIIRFAGVAYLLYLAWSMWREAGAFAGAADQKKERHSGPGIALKGALLNVLNPKLSLFFLAFLPQFLTPGAEPVWNMLLLSSIFMGMTFVVFALYGIFAGRMRQLLTQSATAGRYLQRSFAGVFAALGLRLALEER